MAPGNEYLKEETVQNRLAAHDNKLIKGSTVWFPGEAPEVHWDFNRPKEVELLSAFLDGFQEIDFRDGNVTVADAALATYGSVDDYLLGRIANTHLHPTSAFNINKAKTNGGQVTMATIDGRIIRDDRIKVAQAIVQEKADTYERVMSKRAVTAAKPVIAAIRRGERVAPGTGGDLIAIAREASDNVIRTQQKALGQGE